MTVNGLRGLVGQQIALKPLAPTVHRATFAELTRGSSGSTTSPVTGYCTAWIWAAGNAANVANGSGATMKTFAVYKGQVLSWSVDSAGNIEFVGAPGRLGATAGSSGVIGVGFGGDDNRSGTASSGALSGSSPDFMDTFLTLPNMNILQSNSLWRGGGGGLSRTSGGGGGNGGQTPGGGGGATPDLSTTFPGGDARVILVYSGTL